MRIWPLRLLVKAGLFLIFYPALLNSIQQIYVIPKITMPLPILVTLNSPWASALGAFDMLQVSLGYALIPLIIISSFLIIGSILGRFFCGWVCPVGFIEEIIVKLRGSMPHVPRSTDIVSKRIKYFILLVVLFISGTVALSFSSDWGESYRNALGILAYGPTITIFPDATLFGTIPELISMLQKGLYIQLNALLVFKFIILVVFIGGSYKIPWFWCRYLCPLGALMALFSKFSFLGLKRSPTKCDKCLKCVRICPTQVRILELPWTKINDPDCVLCLDCVVECPQKAINPHIP